MFQGDNATAIDGRGRFEKVSNALTMHSGYRSPDDRGNAGSVPTRRPEGRPKDDKACQGFRTS